MRQLLLILFLLFPGIALSAPDCADPSPAVLRSDSPGSPVSISYTTRSGSNQITFVGIGGRKNTTPPTIGSVQIGGQSMTILDSMQHSTVSSFETVYYKVNPPAGTNNVTFTVTNLPTNTNYVVYTCNDVDVSDPIRSSGQAFETINTTIAVTLGTVDAADTVVDFMETDSTTSVTIGANQTSISTGASGSSTDGSSYQAGSVSPATMSWSMGANDDSVIHAWSLKPAPVASTGGSPLWFQ